MMDRPEEDPYLSPGAFGRALHEFLQVSLELAPAEESELVTKAREHLEVEDLGALPIQSRDLGTPDHPNLQVALDRLVADRGWELEVVGLRSEHAGMMGGLPLQRSLPAPRHRTIATCRTPYD